MTDTTSAIMDAAEERIRKAGYGGFSFREIAADVGVKSSSVHYHFPTKDRLAAAVARRYTDRFHAAVDHKIACGSAPIDAWREAFRSALKKDGKMCLCGALAATSSDLSEEVKTEVKRFFLISIVKLTESGLTRDNAIQVIATLEGAMLMANVLEEASLFDSGSADLV